MIRVKVKEDGLQIFEVDQIPQLPCVVGGELRVAGCETNYFSLVISATVCGAPVPESR